MKVRDVPSRCFQGVAPSIIATCDEQGIPNVTYLSQVFLIDGERVALSCQFFNKTKKNVLANPFACTQILDPLTLDAYRVVLKYDHAETDGPLFESMRRRIDAIASQTGMSGIFKLRSADVYDVVSVEKVEKFRQEAVEAPIEEPAPPWKGEMYALHAVSKRVSAAKDLEMLYTSSLESLHEALGFDHSMMLLPDETGARLYAIASLGYGDAGIGAEVGFGEGLVGTVARERFLLRVAGVGAELRYGRAIRTSLQRAIGARGLRPEIPLPGLVDAQSQMAIPLVTSDRLVGVIAFESKKPAAFEEWHEAFLEIVANQIATAIDNMTLRDKEPEEQPEGLAGVDSEGEATPSAAVPSADCAGGVLKLRFFKSDDCVFSGDEYLVRNLPGRILWKLLREHRNTGRTEFSNRELRLDPALALPAIRDNLESRLVLLRKRLEQKCPEIRLVPTSRGRFRVDVSCPLDLDENA
jgi:adenylate cyclase